MTQPTATQTTAPAGWDVISADDTDDYRTWTFDGEEGGTISITASESALTITQERASYEGRRVSVMQHDDRDAWADALSAELGFQLRTRWVRSQPEPLSY